MNDFLKQVIEEKFASKKQQRYFYAKANDKTLSKKEREKWSKMAGEFSDIEGSYVDYTYSIRDKYIYS